MLQLRRHFSKAFNTHKVSRFSNSRENDSLFDSHNIEIESQCRLPTELLLHIASYIFDRSILAELCRVSKELNYVYTPELYRTVWVHSCNPSTTLATIALHHSLYKTLRNLQRSHLVTDLYICNRVEQMCHKVIYWDDAFRWCTCRKYEQSLERAIVTLHNLRSLTIECSLCEGRHSHSYLLVMDSPYLQRFAFRCFQSGAISKDIMVRVPFMPQITTLQLECYENAWTQPNHPTLSIQDPPFVPLLSTLCYDGTDFARELLSTRPIQRLCLDSWTSRIEGRLQPSLHEDILQGDGKLTHLFLLDLLQWLPDAIATDPEPYRNLRFIGTVSGFQRKDYAAFREMRGLQSLVNLEAIEINRFRLVSDSDGMEWSHWSFQPGRPFFDLLETRHPLLRRVLFMGRYQTSLAGTGSGVLWEKSSVWSSREVPYFDYWSILWYGLKGACLGERYTMD